MTQITLKMPNSCVYMHSQPEGRALAIKRKMNPSKMGVMFPRMPLGGKDQELMLVMALAAKTVKIIMEWGGCWRGQMQPREMRDGCPLYAGVPAR